MKYDFSQLHINFKKLLRKRLKQQGYSSKKIEETVAWVEKDGTACCVFDTHEISLNFPMLLLNFEYYKDYGLIDTFEKYICHVIMHEVMELLINEETKSYLAWHYFSEKLRWEGYGI